MKFWRVALIFFFTFRTLVDAREQPSLLPLQQILAGKRFVDLTHAFAPGIPHWSGFPSEKRETIYWYDKGRGSMGDGFFAGSRRDCHRNFAKSERRFRISGAGLRDRAKPILS
jgi:hypothetical protein